MSSSPPSITMLVSRISARGEAEHEAREATRILRSAGWDVTIELTDRRNHMPDTVRALGPGLIGAVGGDGYLAAVAQGIAGWPDKIMIPFPGGSGNDLCRTLGLGTSSAERARGLVDVSGPPLDERIRALDGMWVTSGSSPRRKLALGVVSLGIDGSANQIANRTHMFSGPAAYTWGAIKAFVQHRFTGVHGIIDGQEHDFTGWISSVSNTGVIGGGVRLVPTSDPFDGILEVFTVGKTRRWTVLPLLARALGRGDFTSPLINIYSGKEITITADEPVAGMADGDFVGYTPLQIVAAPGVIRVVV